MRTLEDFISQLSLGELSNLSIIDPEFPKEIKPTSLDQAILFINLGLESLYTIFPIRKQFVKLKTNVTNTKYTMNFSHAVSNTDPDYSSYEKYLDDSTYGKFSEYFIKILNVLDTNNKQMFINNIESDKSLFINYYDELTIQETQRGSQFIIEYQCGHDRILNNGDYSQKINLPENFYEPLTLYVASNLFKIIGGQENFARASELFSLYNNHLQIAKEMDIPRLSTTHSNMKLYNRGFV